MKQLIKSAIIVEKGNPLNGQKKDIFIEDGIITKIEDNIQDDGHGMHSIKVLRG